MMDAVFISDLHLNPQEPDILERFSYFVKWAAEHTKVVYILGDFFHVWAGDDAQDSFSDSIAQQLDGLAKQGVDLFYIHGNRDFLLGQSFFRRASLKALSDPTVIELGGERVLLTHGDQYCTHDHGHQWLRRLTRNALFKRLFLLVPYITRAGLVSHVRERSQNNAQKPSWKMEIVPSAMIAQMNKWRSHTVIHGHIHKPGCTRHTHDGVEYRQFVLSDWDDNPSILCYYKTSGFCFIPLRGDADVS